MNKKPIYKEVKFRTFLPVNSQKKLVEIQEQLKEIPEFSGTNNDGKFIMAIITSRRPMQELIDEIENTTNIKWSFYEVWGIEPGKERWKKKRGKKHEKANNNI